jgi:hypothetical protein
MPNFLLALIYRKFQKKYDEFFNIKRNKGLVDDWFVLKLKNLIGGVLPGMYYALLYGEDESAKEQYKKRFGKDPETVEDLNLIVNQINKIMDQLSVLDNKPEEKGVSFSELVALIENSRGIPIDRNITLWDFKQIHDLEITKWQQSK